MMKVVTAETMQELDRKTMYTYGVPGSVLMDNAGRGATDVLLRHFPEAVDNTVSIFCGAGNNGGDGYVIARYLMEKGVRACVFLLVPEERVQGDARMHLDILRHSDPRIYALTDDQSLQQYRAQILQSKVLVDAILGTGLTSEVKGHFRKVIEWINDAEIPVVAVDMPSGIHADSGEVMGVAVKAAVTATFGMPKLGQFLYPGAAYVGLLQVVDIGIPESLATGAVSAGEILEADQFKGLLARSPDTHKGTYGHLLVLAGSVGKTGAACLCAEAALRVGAGLVTLAIPESVHPIIAQKLTEVMTLPLPMKGERIHSEKALQRILDFLPAARAVAIGPGLGLDEEVERLVQGIWTAVPLPMVWDADALTLQARNQGLRGTQAGLVIATPHPGEMARLVGRSPSWVQQNRVGVATSFAREWNLIAVLKGARTLIADPSGRLGINLTGNPGMATGGMGDVLTGMIGGCLAQGVCPFDAACLSVFLHGAAGDVTAREVGPIGYLASELMLRIPTLFGTLRIA